MDQQSLADFLRTRREALQPEDVGMPRGPRRRTRGLRREEVAALAGMSPDYYARLERGAGPQPSESMTAGLAGGLRLSLDERDHLFRLAGHHVPGRGLTTGHVGPGLMRILDRLQDTPAQVMGGVGETLSQTRLAVALFGDQTRYVGNRRSAVYRWFTEPESRAIYLPEDHPKHGRDFAAQLRRVVASHGRRSAAADLSHDLRALSSEFAAIWADHEVDRMYTEEKRFVHPQVGRLDLFCQTLLDPGNGQSLLVFTSTPGSASQERLNLLSVIGGDHVLPTSPGSS